MIDTDKVMQSAATDKKELIDFFMSDSSPSYRRRILEETMRREGEAPTFIGKGVAFPHAVLKEQVETKLFCCFAPKGVVWNSAGESARVILFLVSNEEEHLSNLMNLATGIQIPGVQDKLSRVTSAGEITALLEKALEQKEERETSGVKERITDAVIRQVQVVTEEFPTAKLVVFSNALVKVMALGEKLKGRDLILVSSVSRVLDRQLLLTPLYKTIYPIQGFLKNRKEILKRLWSDDIITGGDTVISLSGFEFEPSGQSLTISSIPEDLYDEARVLNYQIPHNVNLETLSRVIALATELASEGREGKPAGAIFVVGDNEGVREYCKQLIINPFGGLKDHERSILDPGLWETLKEFSKIDGAYIIGNNGYIYSGGTYLSIPPHQTKLQPGLGARHASALGITLVAPVASVVVSESTGHVRVFWDGLEQDLFTPDE